MKQYPEPRVPQLWINNGKTIDNKDFLSRSRLEQLSIICAATLAYQAAIIANPKENRLQIADNLGLLDLDIDTGILSEIELVGAKIIEVQHTKPKNIEQIGFNYFTSALSICSQIAVANITIGSLSETALQRAVINPLDETNAFHIRTEQSLGIRAGLLDLYSEKDFLNEINSYLPRGVNFSDLCKNIEILIKNLRLSKLKFETYEDIVKHIKTTNIQPDLLNAVLKLIKFNVEEIDCWRELFQLPSRKAELRARKSIARLSIRDFFQHLDKGHIHVLIPKTITQRQVNLHYIINHQS
jgi:hypothetical protein